MIEHTSAWVLANSTDPMDPAEIDWPARQARALIPFEVFDGRPMCSCGYASWHADKAIRGRNDLPLWGENPMADALVTCTFRGVRNVLLIERGDGGGWAMPGGAVERRDDSPLLAAARELEEETGLDPRLPIWKTVTWFVDQPRWVPDPRGSMEAWAVTVVARCDLGEVDALPEVRGGDDARAARWWRIQHGEFLTNLFPAHREILSGLR